MRSIELVYYYCKKTECMRFSLRIFLSIFGIVLSTVVSQAKRAEVKWGKADHAEFVKDKNEDAGAVILFDIGELNFEYASQGTKITLDRHVRIRINNKSGFDMANIEIPYFSGNQNEWITEIKAQTLSETADGKIEKVVLDKDAIFTENIDGKWMRKKFSLPAIKDGCIIEYHYKMNSFSILTLRTWHFQNTVPTIFSEYTTRIPEFYKYIKFIHGSSDYIEHCENYTIGEWLNMVILGQSCTYTARNLPAFREEPLMINSDDYVCGIEFQLKSVGQKGFSNEKVLYTWEELSDVLTNELALGKVISGGSRMKEAFKSFGFTPEDSAKSRMIEIYDYMRNTFRWNNVHSIFADELNKVVEQKSGNSADINLLMGNMMRQAGLDVKPVLISTTDHGEVNALYPQLNQFNHLLLLVTIDKVLYSLDATGAYNPYNLLPETDLNGRSFVLNGKSPEWIDLHAGKKSRYRASLVLSIDSAATITGKGEFSCDGYIASSLREKLSRTGEKEYVKNYIVRHLPDAVPSNMEFKNREQVEESLKMAVDLKYAPDQNAGNEFLYMQPLLYETIRENPFSSDHRKYPVNYIFTREETVLVNLTLPSGYSVVEFPPPVKLVLPDNSGEYTYHITSDNNQLKIMRKFSINKREFAADEYADLKEFYNKVLAKDAEQVVIKKTQ
jgi:Domain of Unknown Function with PDB structure (DUF3857)